MKKDFSQAAEGKVVESGNVANAADEAAKLEALKLKKKEAAKAWNARKQAEKLERVEKAKKLLEAMKANGSYEKLDGEMKAFVTSLANPVSAGGNNGGNNSLFAKLFGDNPQVGAKFTLREAFEKTLKGKSNIDFYVKRWASKGTVVSFTQNNENMLDSVYTLDAIGTGTAEAEA